ncbi:MAG: hypothetical protein LBI61_02670 [Puniceicoccales bacterium]|nr:hypothetical protein [Puniceicoccales bacterium]
MKRKYFDSAMTVSLRMILWSLREFLRVTLAELLCPIYAMRRLNFKAQANKRLRILITLYGGIGDMLMYSLAVKEIARRINCEYSMDVVSNPWQTEDLRFIFSGFDFLNVVQNQPASVESYDVSLKINRVVKILACDHAYVAQKSPWLYSFCIANENFFMEKGQFFGKAVPSHALLDQWSILKHQKRIQQPDQPEILGISDQSHTLLSVKPDGLRFIETIGLRNAPYITIQSGVNRNDKTCKSTRMWPTSHYKKFVELFHAAFPGVKVIQLGFSEKFCESIADADINLIGKTSLDQVAALLKHSLFHLDGDAGMVHIKKFLNGRSIAMFGTTSAELLGYPENINITGNGCNSWCEWVTKDWFKKCLRGLEEAPCMLSIAPETVMEAAKKIMDKKEYSHSVVAQNIEESKIADYVLSRNANRKIKIIDIFNKNGLAVARELRKNFDDIIFFGSNFKFDSFAKAKGEGLQLEYGCLYNISMHDDSSDVVIWQSGDSVIPQLAYVLRELFRMLKPNGMLIISGVSMSVDDLKAFGIEAQEISANSAATVFTKTL